MSKPKSKSESKWLDLRREQQSGFVCWSRYGVKWVKRMLIKSQRRSSKKMINEES